MKKWNKDYYTVSVPELDDQHEQLFVKLTSFIELVRQGSARTELLTLLDFLEKYTQEHFTAEERAMAQYDCPSAEQNLIEHKGFLDKLHNFKNELSSQGPSQELAGRVQKELYLWLIGHIARVDKALAQTIASCNKKKK